jgi:hypothetical protein
MIDPGVREDPPDCEPDPPPDRIFPFFVKPPVVAIRITHAARNGVYPGGFSGSRTVAAQPPPRPFDRRSVPPA